MAPWLMYIGTPIYNYLILDDNTNLKKEAEKKLTPIMVDTPVLLVETVATAPVGQQDNSEERLNFHRMNGSLPMPLPTPWKSGNQSPVLSPFGLSLISSHIGDLGRITTIGTLVCIGWVQLMLALVLPVMAGDFEASGTEASLVAIITKE